jgi:gliding motility-associated-like protein
MEIPLEDNQDFEGLRASNINLALPVGCGNDTFRLSLPLQVKDYAAMEVNYSDTILLGCNDDALVEINVEGGKLPYTINWNNAEANGFSFVASPTDSATYTATLSDDCGIHSRELAVYVFRESHEPLQVTTPGQVDYNCLQALSINPLVQGGSGDYSFSWKQNDVEIASTPDFDQIIGSDSTLVFTVSDPCVDDVMRNIDLQLINNPIFLSMGEDTVGYCDEEMRIVPEVSGGFGQILYQWTANGADESGLSIYAFEPEATTIVSLYVQDQCGQTVNDTLLVRVNKPPLLFDLPADTAICRDEQLILNPGASGGYGSYKYTWNGQPDENGILSAEPAQDRNYEFSIRDECETLREHTVSVSIAEVVADFNFNEDSRYSFIENYSTEGCAYEWVFPDGSVSSAFEPDVNATEISGGLTFLKVENQLGCTANARQRFEPGPKIFIPTAFTPDGDGLNEVFKAEGEYVASFEMVIFDKWGSEVYRITNIEQGWNGELSRSGSYAGENSIYNYIYTAKTLDGKSVQGKGTVTVVR